MWRAACIHAELVTATAAAIVTETETVTEGTTAAGLIGTGIETGGTERSEVLGTCRGSSAQRHRPVRRGGSGLSQVGPRRRRSATGARGRRETGCCDVRYKFWNVMTGLHVRGAPVCNSAGLYRLREREGGREGERERERQRQTKRERQRKESERK